VPYILDDTEVNTPVFGGLLSESQTIRAIGTANIRRRKPRRLTIINRLRLIQDSSVKAKIIEVLQQAQPSAAPPRLSSARGKKYRPVASSHPLDVL
jgi:hypothetical protein